MSLRSVFTALVMTTGLLVAAPASAGDAEFGRVVRHDGVLKKGCKNYRFKYRVRPDSNDWFVEFFLVGPGKEGLGTVGKTSEIDRKRGRAHFKVCRAATRPGRFKIRGKLTFYEEQSFPESGTTQTVTWIKPARFRLRRR